MKDAFPSFSSAIERGMNFKEVADKVAFSRRRNTARLPEEPVRYTRSLFKELKLRLGCKTDEETIKILTRYRNLKEKPDKYKPTKVGNDNVIVIEDIFEGEKDNNPLSFIANKLCFLDFPSWLADTIDENIKAKESHGRLIYKSEFEGTTK